MIHFMTSIIVWMQKSDAYMSAWAVAVSNYSSSLTFAHMLVAFKDKLNSCQVENLYWCHDFLWASFLLGLMQEHGNKVQIQFICAPLVKIEDANFVGAESAFTAV